MPKTTKTLNKKKTVAGKKPLKKTVKQAAPKKKIAIPSQVIKYLENAGIKHEVLEHRTVYTALDAAMTLKKKLDEIAKSLLVMADKDYYLILLPADKNLDFEKLAKTISRQTKKEIKTVKIPSEKVMEDILKIKSKSIHAFGSLNKLPVYMEKSLTKAKKAIFSSGSYNYSIEMLVNDFIKMENAVLGVFGVKKKVKLQPAKNAKTAKKTIKVKKKK